MSADARLGSSTEFGAGTFKAPVTDVHIQMANGSTVRFAKATMTYGARLPGKSIAALIGQPLLPFHTWKEAFRRLEAPRVRPTSEYHSHYGYYCERHRRANPPGGIQQPPSTVGASNNEGTE